MLAGQNALPAAGLIGYSHACVCLHTSGHPISVPQGARSMEPAEVLEKLQRLLPSQLNLLAFRLDVDLRLDADRHMPGESAPHSDRALTLYKLVEQRKQLARLQRELDLVYG